MSFDEALKSDVFGTEIQRYGVERIAWEFGLDPVSVILNSAALNDGAMVFGFTKQGQEAYKAGRAIVPIHKESGHFLGVLQDSETRKFIEVATGKTTTLARLSQISAIVISTAHIISSADTLGRLQAIDSKVDFLVSTRTIDQRAEIKTLYNRAREALDGTLTDQRRVRLSGYRDKLCRLRETWRLEIEHLIEHAPGNKTNFMVKHLPVLGPQIQQSKDRKLLEHFGRTVPLIRQSRLALFMDVCLAMHLGESETLIAHIVRDEARAWSPVLSSSAQKTAALLQTEDSNHARALQEHLSSQVDILRSLSEGVADSEDTVE